MLGHRSFYDPLQLKVTRADFEEEDGEDLGFEDWFFPQLKERNLIAGVFLFGDLARQVRSRRGRPSFLGHEVVPLDGSFELPSEALEDRRVEKSLIWSGQIGYLWVGYRVPLREPELWKLLGRWVPEERLPGNLVGERPGLEPLTVAEESWRRISALAARFDRGYGLLSTANEGALITVVGHEEDLRAGIE